LRESFGLVGGFYLHPDPTTSPLCTIVMVQLWYSVILIYERCFDMLRYGTKKVSAYQDGESLIGLYKLVCGALVRNTLSIDILNLLDQMRCGTNMVEGR
jgi:hypothetical protein